MQQGQECSVTDVAAVFWHAAVLFVRQIVCSPCLGVKLPQ